MIFTLHTSHDYNKRSYEIGLIKEPERGKRITRKNKIS